MKSELIRQIMAMLPSHPNPAAALFMIYWIARSDPQQRVLLSRKMYDDLRIFVDGCFSMTVMASLKSVIPASHEECLQSVENDIAYSYAEYPEISRKIELYIKAVDSLSKDSQDRVMFRTISGAIGLVAVAKPEIVNQ